MESSGGEQKLIRDLIPRNAAQRNPDDVMVIRKVEGAELIEMLRAKLDEEVREFFAAETPEARVEEVADVMEVLSALLRHDGSTLEAVESVRMAKREKRGGFDEGVVWLKPTA